MQVGHANGVAPGFPLSDKQKQKMIEKAAKAYGKFLDELGCDWRNDPNSSDTPRRVAKAYVNDLWAGRYTLPTEITSFPSDGYDGIIQESNIPVTSMCSHHHQTIKGLVSVAYVVASICFILSLGGLSHQESARRGNLYGVAGIIIAVGATLASVDGGIVSIVTRVCQFTSA